MNRALTAIAAAAGIMGCAKDVPVYSPERELVQEVPGASGVYKQVWSNAERLEVSWYVQSADGKRPLYVAWTRYEPEDSGACVRKSVFLYADVDNLEYEISGEVQLNFADDGCDGSVDSCRGLYTPYNGASEDISASVCANSDRDFREFEEGIDRDIYNLDEQVRLWHERKGVEE